MAKKVKYQSINLKCKNKLNTNFLLAYFKITSKCMLNCPFCSQGCNPEASIKIDDAKLILKKLKKIGIKSITYTGGEPLMYKDLLKLVQFGKKIGFEQTVVTNGIMIDNIDTEIFNYISAIGISLHGTKEIHDKVIGKNGVYNQVEKNIDYIAENYKHISLNINCTITKENMFYENFKYLVDFAKKRKIKICFGRLNYIGLSKNADVIDPDIYLEIIDALKRGYDKIEVSNCISLCTHNSKYNYLNHSCGAGQTMLAIEPNGDVKICASSNIVIGNLLKSNYLKVVSSKKLKDYKNLKWIPMACNNCKKFALCKGGCHAEGTGEFYNSNCDGLLLNKFEMIWGEIKKKKMNVKNCYIVKKRINKYLIINNPLRVINKTGIDIMKCIDGTRTISELEKKFLTICNFKEFIVSLYIDGMLVEI